MPTLEEDFEYFESIRDTLLKEHFGKVALVKNKAVVGIFDTDQAAYDEGMRLFPGEEFLIQEILTEDVLRDMPAVYFGLLNAF